MAKIINGFSKLSKKGKLEWMVNQFFNGSADAAEADMERFWLTDPQLQKVLDGFSENTVSNYVMPYGLAPNFSINGKAYCVPMVIEESSVVAAASAAAKYWLSRGGFHAKVIDSQKIGQVHFHWEGDFKVFKHHFSHIRQTLIEESEHITHNMRQRGGGILDIQLLDFSHLEPHYYQLHISFETCDSMGANFINSVLEQFGHTLKHIIATDAIFDQQPRHLSVIMAILSNYTPNCVVSAWVECPVEKLTDCGMEAVLFAEKFHKAVRIAHIDPYRATTHNKGIFNGIDAVVLATANDFRAIEACGHAYAARDGQYKSLSNCCIENGVFRFWLDIPLAVGTVGGLTSLHPLAKRSLEMLGNPSAHELMQIIAVTGLAQNFAALRSLTTTGIQKGHMKMHLTNILNHLKANAAEASQALTHFEQHAVTFSAVRDFMEKLRVNV